jgi:uncharacterized protein
VLKIKDMDQGFNIIIKPTGARCNIACEYCYFLRKERLYLKSDFRMSSETLEVFIRQYIEAQIAQEVIFTWQGGEPTLMGIPFYQKAVEYQQRFQKEGMRIFNNFQTNGLLLNEDWCRFLSENNFLVGLSLDGPETLHDAFRKTTGGDGTFSQVLRGLGFLKKHKVETNILTCISKANVGKPLIVYQFLRDELEMQHIQFIPIVERLNPMGNQYGEKLSSRSISGEEYGAFLTVTFDEWIQNDVGHVFIQLFETCLGVSLGAGSSICIFQPTCGFCLALEHNGDLYSCDHYVQPDALLGNIHSTPISEMMISDLQVKFGLNKKDHLPSACKHCELLFICNGGCPKNRISNQKKGDFPINHLCSGYKSFFSHIREPMQMMVSLIQMQRPVSDIMNIYQSNN